MGKKGIQNWLISLSVNAVIMAAVLILTDLTYETNDDFAISAEIAAGYPYVGFVSVYFCRLLVAIQKVFPAANVFIYSQIVLSFIAFTVLVRIIFERQKSLLLTLLSLLITAYFSLDHYGCLQFTKTSALLMAAGLIWVADNYIHERSVLYFILAFALYFIGVSYRQKGMFPAVAYCALFMLLWWLCNGREFFKERKPLPEIGLALIIMMIMIVPYGIDLASDAANAGTPELKAGRDYQRERTLVTDYPVIEYLEQNVGEYAEAGLSENDLTLIDRWFFDYDGAASYENLKTINRINAPYANMNKSLVKAFKKAVRQSMEEVLSRDMVGCHIIFALMIALYLLIDRRPRAWLYIIVLGALTVGLYTALYYMDRVQYRAIYLPDVSVVFWLLYLAAISDRPEQKIPGNIILAAGIIAVMISLPAGIRATNSMVEYNSTLIETPEISEYLTSHPDNFYILPTISSGQPETYMTPLKAPLFHDNMADTGGWDTLTPYRLDHLRAHGLDNPIRDLINREGVYYIGDYKVKALTEYFNKWYCGEGEKAEFVKVDEVDDNGVYSIVIE